jgi:hypothetical protein
MDELSLIFERLTLSDKNNIKNTIEKIDKKNNLQENTNYDLICNSLNNLKLDNFQEEIKPIIKEKIINSIIQISKILLNKQK